MSEDQQKPFPLKQCMNCLGTMWKQARWIQCLNCGALSTEYGGCFLDLSPKDEQLGPAPDFKAAVDEVKAQQVSNNE